ncbi:HAD family hydrolase [Actinokineospora sp. HUAS TT18]|uniref:HAD family hydrolase n=1 Tax=Actinokineospora sp. HUAS TT18 TaxID=3447451 RepID=UPI003F525D64
MTSALVPFQLSASPLSREHCPPVIHAICLDIDDTVIDYTGSARSALSELIGRDDMWQAWQRVTDEYSARAVAGELDHVTMRRTRTKAFLADLGVLLDDEAVAELEERRLRRMHHSWRLFPDTRPCLDWLRAAGFTIAAVTNASAPHQRARLETLGISRFFDVVVSAGELGVAKPDPAIFHEACHQLGVPPAQTLHVGDRADLDAAAARAAGLHGVWLNRSGAELETAAPMIETLADLPELLVTDYRTPTLTSASGVPTPRG